MYNYRLLIQYDGSRYKGWQKLDSESDTIQGRIEDVLSRMAGTKVDIVGSGRTDAGVHALGQVANFWTEAEYSPNDIKDYLNRYLPRDIAIVDAARVEESFHSRYHATAKTYLYKIWNAEYGNPFLRKYSMHIAERLDISGMKKAAQHFIGEHDFTAFSNAKSKKKSMVRVIYSIEIENPDNAGLINIHIKGNGFLYNMARRMVGTLVAVGLGEISSDSIPEIIRSGQRSRAGYIAEPGGLYLESVEYS